MLDLSTAYTSRMKNVKEWKSAIVTSICLITTGIYIESSVWQIMAMKLYLYLIRSKSNNKRALNSHSGAELRLDKKVYRTEEKNDNRVRGTIGLIWAALEPIWATFELFRRKLRVGAPELQMDLPELEIDMKRWVS